MLKWVNIYVYCELEDDGSGFFVLIMVSVCLVSRWDVHLFESFIKPVLLNIIIPLWKMPPFCLGIFPCLISFHKFLPLDVDSFQLSLQFNPISFGLQFEPTFGYHV